MKKDRLEGFSDGVVAILITIMVLDLRIPHGSDWAAIRQMLPTMLMYVLSFVFVGIYWNSHHHLMTLVGRVTGGILWANTHLLFWLSLVPFVTRWMGESGFEPLPVAVYGGVLLLTAVAFTVLVAMLVRGQGDDGRLRNALGGREKERLSLLLYAAGVGLAYPARYVSLAIYAAVALIWLIPDRRIERVHRP